MADICLGVFGTGVNAPGDFCPGVYVRGDFSGGICLSTIQDIYD